MKYIIIGLGNFGSVLAERLTDMGNEVIGVDIDPHKVEDMKQKLASVICLDSRDTNALSALPLKDTDIVFVTIGEDFGSSIHIIALLKQFNVKKLVGRAMSPLHKTVMEVIGVDEIIMPERDYAETYAMHIEMSGTSHSYMIDDQHTLMELPSPELFVRQTVGEIGFFANLGLTLVAIKRLAIEQNILHITRTTFNIISDFDDSTVIQEGDSLLLFGKIKNFQKFRSL